MPEHAMPEPAMPEPERPRFKVISAAPPQGNLHCVRMASRELALSVLVQLSLAAPAFASQKFGTWSRVLIGQVNRGDYVVLLQNGRPVGYAGWFAARKADAEAWLEREVDIPDAPLAEADCAVMNAFMAPSPEASRYLREAFLRQIPTLSMIYAKRIKAGKRRLARVPNPRRTAANPPTAT
jgi:hemolysin-activating ACP:hemolysin acyltransferase